MKIYIVQYISVNQYSYEYSEDTNIEEVAFKSYRAASEFILKGCYYPYSNKNGHGETVYELDWMNDYNEFADIIELEITE